MDSQINLSLYAWYGVTLLVSGLVLFMGGISHRYARIAVWDGEIFTRLYRWLGPASRIFAYIWPVGTTPVAIVMIALLFIPDPSAGLIAALVYLGMAIIERLIKNWIRRPRPFQTLAGIAVHQTKIPGEPSFPSGDAMRAWYIGLLLPIVFGLPGWVSLLAAWVAFILSLGRIALGVHYPLDVIAGSALGLFGAGLSILIAGI